MTTTTKSIFALIGAVIIGVAIYGAYQYPQVPLKLGGTGVVNSTNSIPSWDTVTFAPTNNATTTTITNNSGVDRYIISNVASCAGNTSAFTAVTGAGLANLVFTAATTTGAITGNLANVNTNYIMNDTISTTTPWSQVASSTEGVLTGTSRVWPAGMSLTFSSNATTTAICTVGVEVVQS